MIRWRRQPIALLSAPKVIEQASPRSSDFNRMYIWRNFEISHVFPIRISLERLFLSNVSHTDNEWCWCSMRLSKLSPLLAVHVSSAWHSCRRRRRRRSAAFSLREFDSDDTCLFALRLFLVYPLEIVLRFSLTFLSRLEWRVHSSERICSRAQIMPER